jgi:putative MATE family efflux protein
MSAETQLGPPTSQEAAERAPGPARQMAVLGAPLLLGALSSTMSGVIDTAMMGRFGTADLAAVSGASAVFDVFSAVVLASLVGHQILAARFAGRNDPPGLRRSLRQSALWCGGLALLLTLACELAGGPLTGLVGDNRAELTRIGAQYLATRGPTLLLLVPFGLLTATFNAYRRPRYAAAAGIAVNVVNLLLDWLLIDGPGPLPRLGATGNGLATTLAWLVGVGWLALAAHRFRLARTLRGPGPAEPAGFPTSIPRLAWPSIVSSGLDYASMAIFFAIVAGLGTSALAGGRIAFEVQVLVFGTGSAFAAAGRILIGRAIGAGEPARSRALWRTGRHVLLGPGVLVGLLLAVLAAPVSRLFTSAPSVVTQASHAMPLIGLCVPLMAWTLGNVSLIRALGHTRMDMYANLASAVCIQLPVGWLLAGPAGLGIPGAYAGLVAYWAARTLFTEIAARRLQPG